MWVDYIPASFSETRFRMIWTVVIGIHVIFDVLLFISLIACCIRHKRDYTRDEKYNAADDEEENHVIEVENVHYNGQAGDDEFDKGDAATSKTGKSGGTRTRKSGIGSVTTINQYKIGKRRSCCGIYFILFFLKNPILNPIIAKHPTVPRLCRGLIHYSMYFVWTCITAGILHVDSLNDYWMIPIFVSYPIVWIFTRVFNFFAYFLCNWERKIVAIIVSIIILIFSLGLQVAMYFIVEALEWQ